MMTYVFGAGASQHVGFPLAKGLGNALKEWIHRSKPADHEFRKYIALLQKLYGGLDDFEHILTDLDECRPGSSAATLPGHVRPYVLSHLRHSIREFLNDISRRPAPLYQRLASERIQPGDVIITFNYDTVCERELKRAGLWEIGDGYGFSLALEHIPPSPVLVLKLHGSTNWWELIFGGIPGAGQASNSLGYKPVIPFPPDFEFFDYPADVRDPACRGIDRVAGDPAIIMPTQRKRFFVQTHFGREWEPFWQNLWDQAADALGSTEKIVIIGYSMARADERARELLLERSNCDARIDVFCGKSTPTVSNEFASHGFSHVNTYGRGHFEDYLGA